MNREEDITPTGYEIQQSCNPQVRWCRFCKHFLTEGLLLRETSYRIVTLAYDGCAKYRRHTSFFPTPCQEARTKETLCGLDGRDYQECEDRWKALSPELQAIEYYKRGRLPDGSDPRPPAPRPWYIRLRNLLFPSDEPRSLRDKIYETPTEANHE